MSRGFSQIRTFCNMSRLEELKTKRPVLVEYISGRRERERNKKREREREQNKKLFCQKSDTISSLKYL